MNESTNNARPDIDPDERTFTLERLERWWKTTNNPLFIWEAVALCLNDDQPNEKLPDFCRAYLKDAAASMTLLSWGRDFKTKKKIPPKRAFALVPEALSLSRERSKNAFSRYAEDAKAMRVALDYEFHRGFLGEDEAAKNRDCVNIGSTRVTKERATRIVSRGRALLGKSRKAKKG